MDEQPKKRKLPPELEFLIKIPAEGELEPDEYLVWAREYLDKIRQHHQAMRDFDLDPDAMIAHLTPSLEEAEHAQKKFETAEDSLLQSRADLADQEFELFKQMRQLVKQAHDQNPFNPQVQEWMEQIEDWEKNFPRD